MKFISKQTQRKLLLKLVPPIAERWMWFYDWATRLNNNARLSVIDPTNLLEQKLAGKQVIAAFWHNRVAFGPTAYVYAGGKKGAVMVSRSFDGDLFATVADRFGVFKAARGSSSKAGQDKGGQEALGEMIDHSKQGYDLLITPDGPRGPRYEAKRGIVDLASITGLPVYLIGVNCTRYLQATSWDRTRVPIPFSKVVYIVDGPLFVPQNADEKTIEHSRKEIESRLNKITKQADHYFD